MSEAVDSQNTKAQPILSTVQEATRRIQSVECRYVFVDIVGFSKRTAEAQADIVQKLNDVVTASISAVGLSPRHSKEVICIPTGDGLCIAILATRLSVDELIDIHLRLACTLLAGIALENKNEADDERRFQLRVGLNENIDIAVKDINGRKNVAGAGINEAARIMDLADSNQILVGQTVFNRLEKRDNYRDVFKSYKAVVKHGVEMSVFQFAPEQLKYDFDLNRQTPRAIERSERQQLASEIIETNGLLYEGMRGLIARAEHEVLLVARHREWIYPLATTLIMARSRGVQVTMSHYPDSADELGRGQLRFLSAIGCHIVEHAVEKSVPVEGVFTDYLSNQRVEGIVCTEKPEIYGYYGRKLHTRGDRKLLNTVIDVVLRRELSGDIDPSSVQPIKEADEATVCDWLQRVPSYQGCEINLELVRVRDTRPLAPEVLLYKIEQARALADLWQKSGWKVFQPAGVVLKNGKISPIMPPVLEEREGTLYVAEGHSRLYSRWVAGDDQAIALVVRGVAKPMQKAALYWREVRLDSHRAKSAFANDPQAKVNARDIENYVHQDLW